MADPVIADVVAEIQSHSSTSADFNFSSRVDIGNRSQYFSTKVDRFIEFRNLKLSVSAATIAAIQLQEQGEGGGDE